jgi:hypothetical protein
MNMKTPLKRLLLAAIMVGFAVPMLLAATCDLSETYGVTSANSNSPNQQKQAVCHKGKKTLFLPPPAAQAHINHGDHPGACP